MTVTTDGAWPSTAERPPRSQRLRSLSGWAIVVALVLIGVFVATQVGVRMPDGRGALDPDSASGSGAMALRNILEEHGVRVEVHRSRTSARDSVDEGATLVMANPYTLSDEAVAELIEPASSVVFLSSSTALLNQLGIGENASPDASAVAAGCDAAEFAAVGDIRPDRLFAPSTGVEGCFGTDPAVAAAVLIDDRADRTRVVVEGGRLFSNGYLAEDGNAALALALLGQTERVVWYVPSFEDTDIEGEIPETLGDLTPEWVTPVILLLILGGVAAALWKGRRFGPLVAETLPVTVRASETMHGRARLTAKAGDSSHAAAAIRDGTKRRLASMLGLPSHAAAEQVADAASDRLRVPRGSLYSLLNGAPPAHDGELVELARRLRDIEDAVGSSTREMRGDR